MYPEPKIEYDGYLWAIDLASTVMRGKDKEVDLWSLACATQLMAALFIFTAHDPVFDPDADDDDGEELKTIEAISGVFSTQPEIVLKFMRESESQTVRLWSLELYQAGEQQRNEVVCLLQQSLAMFVECNRELAALRLPWDIPVPADLFTPNTLN